MRDKNPKEYKKFINSITMLYTYDWNKDIKEYIIKSK
jgi:hypothetical protein